MTYTDEQLSWIYDRTSGYCHICHRKLAYVNYGLCGERGAWEVDHSNPRKRGGTNRRSNLYACCIACNRSKQHRTTKVARYANGTARAPLDRQKRASEKMKYALLNGSLAAVAGGLILGPVGAVAGAIIVGSMCHKENPDRR